MDELLSLFNADDNDTSHQETQPATQTRKTKYQGAPSYTNNYNNDFGSSFASAFATQSNTNRPTNEENILNKSRVVKQHQSYTTTTKSTTITQKHKSNNTTTCSDPYTNFVITDRRTSRANMVNAFSTLTYKSCSVLAASSRAEWNTFMIDGGGSSNGGGNGPSGKTKLATCGILTQDVSSKLSSKTGRAFAKLSLGDLSSSSSSTSFNNTITRGSNNISPSITVFLFGDAINILKSNMKYMKAGYAIAILQPNLMPNNNNNSGGSGTSITLSINNPAQLLAIGRAQDCSKCMGTHRVRTQSEYGGVKWEDVRCTTLVDTRLGGYCDKHKRQGLGGKSNSSNNKDNSMTFMQKQRAQNNQQQGMSQMRGSNNRGGDVWVGQRGGHTNASSFNNLGHQGGRSTTSFLSEALSQSGILGLGQQSTQQSISSLGGSKQKILKRAPLHMKKSQPISSTTGNKLAPVAASTTSSGSTIKNPYNKSSQQASQTKPSNQRKRKEVDDILGEALGKTRSIDKPNHRPETMMKKKKTSLLSSSTTKRPLKVFTTEGYDGSVHVPKPNKLLFQRGASTSAASSMITPSPDNNRTLSSALILDKQRNLAELLKSKQGSISTTPATNMKRGFPINKDTLARSKQKIVSTTSGGIKVVKRSTNSFQSKTNNRYNDFASAFGSTGSGGSLSTEADIMNAKSRFSSVTDAQEYARARAQVQELEAREATKEGYNNKKKKKDKASDVAIKTIGWVCRTCRKTTPFKPVACIKSRHDVRQKREIKGQETLSKRKDRLDRHGKDDKEGGLTLGSGVEWTRLEWSRGGL